MSRFLSPLRYPGGKSWLVPHIKKIVKEWYPNGLDFLYEPFCGGASVSLDALTYGWANYAYLNDIDLDIYAFWQTLRGFRYYNFKTMLREIEELDGRNLKLENDALKTLLKNRMTFTGAIDFKLSGKSPQQIKRWNKEEIFRRCQLAHGLRDQFDISDNDYLVFLERMECRQGSDKTHLFYLDPPYITAGKRLYKNASISFPEMIVKVEDFKCGVIISYEHDDQAAAMAVNAGFSVEEVGTMNVKKEFLFTKRPSK